MRDTIHLHGLKLDVVIGFHDVERDITQQLLADITVETDFRTGPQDDVRSGLVDYYELERKLRARVAGRSFELIEAVAVALAREVLEHHPKTRVHVRVTKHPLDMPGVARVSVECVRERPDFP